MRSLLVTTLFLTVFVQPFKPVLRAQQLPPDDLLQQYRQVLQLNGVLPVHPDSGAAITPALRNPGTISHPWKDRPAPVFPLSPDTRFVIAPHDFMLSSYWQSREPYPSNDGPIWQGRGYTGALSGGFFMRYGILSGSLRPTVIFTQNRSFPLSPYIHSDQRSKFAYPLGNVDWPQRFGEDSFWRLDAGHTYLRADYSGWATGISNENRWWSPARRQALLLGTGAPGFPHFFIGTNQPKNIGIGHLQTTLIWGKLRESGYFDFNPENNERYITGGRVAFTPEPVPGLTLGINRIFYETIPPEGIPAGDLLKIFESFTKVNFTGSSNPGGNDQADQLLSLFGSWKFPASGLEIYGEWARTDHSWNWRDFVTEPEHSRGYTLGLVKVFELNNTNLLSLNAELTQLEANKTGQFRSYPTFYVHGRTRQGYSHKGQLLGASIGPGSSSQFLGSEFYFGKGRLAFWMQRVALNNDFLYKAENRVVEQNSPSINRYWLHNIEMRLGGAVTYFYRQFETSLGFTVRRELNDDYIYKNDQFHFGLEFAVRYRL